VVDDHLDDFVPGFVEEALRNYLTCGGSCMGRLARTKYNLRNTPEHVTTTRAHHPLREQIFEVLVGGREQITICLPDGASMRVPRRLQVWFVSRGGVVLGSETKLVVSEKRGYKSDIAVFRDIAVFVREALCRAGVPR